MFTIIGRPCDVAQSYNYIFILPLEIHPGVHKQTHTQSAGTLHGNDHAAERSDKGPTIESQDIIAVSE